MRALAFLLLLLPTLARAESPVERRSGTVSIKNEAAYSFETTVTNEEDTIVRAKLCFPRHETYVLQIQVSGRAFDLSFCPFSADPEDLDRRECIQFQRLPRPAGIPAGREASLVIGSSLMAYRSREFEFFFEDAMTPTMGAWISEEWQQVDHRLRAAFVTLLCSNVRVNIGVGTELSLALALLAPQDVHRYRAEDVLVDTARTFCSEAGRTAVR